MRRSLLTTCAVVAFAGSSTAQDVQLLLGQPVPGLSDTQLQLFHEGRVAFAAPLEEAEGLGPIFNDPACGSCHNHPAQGGSGTREVTRFGKAGTPFDPLESLGGSLLQDQALDVACLETIPASADVIANRVTPICFGAGLLEVMVHQDIVDNELNQPPHLNGFVSWVGDLSAPGDPPQPARFGWKGVVHNVITFSIDASLNEMGLTSVFLPNENAPNGDQALLAACDNVADPEDLADASGFTKIDRFTHFQRFLAAPAQVPPSGLAGEAVFGAIGCADCHRPTYKTGAAPEAALSGKVIQPYSDFLLHDMAEEGDQIAQGNAAEGDMQTRALWGLRHRLSFMHDGDVIGMPFEQLMDACIQRHAGEGAKARTAYNALGGGQQQDLHFFLASLGQSHFDFEDTGGLVRFADNDRDVFDWFFIEPMFNGEAPGSFTVDDYDAVTDVQGDGDFDLREFGLFQAAFTGELVGEDPPTFGAVVDDVQFRVRAGGSNVTVAPGGLVRYEVICEALGPNNQGVAMVAFDLNYKANCGGCPPAPPLKPARVPTHGPMTDFVSPVGLSNPQGFGGVPVGNGLLQVGGAMNTINNSFAPQPNGTVTTGLGAKGSPLVVAEGALVAAAGAGNYVLTCRDPMVNLITPATTGAPFWEVQEAGVSSVRDLRIVVSPGAPEIYCKGKPSSDGCTPEIFWSGVPSLTGPDNFLIRVKKTVPGEPGLAVLGLAAQNVPFMKGTLCVGNFIGRGSTVNANGSGACQGRYIWRLRQGEMINLGLNPGDVVHAQWYFRDTAQADGTNVGLSDAIRFTVQP